MADAGTAQADRPPVASPEAIAQIRRLQRDGLVLVAHLAESQDRRLVRARRAGTAPDAAAAERSPLPADLSLLTWPPEMVAAFGASFTRLVETVDQLSRAARPATPLSIQFTAAYLYTRSGRPETKRRQGEDPQPDPCAPLQPTRTELDRARDVRRKLHLLRGLLLLGMLLAVWLLMHVNSGHRILAERAAVQAELTRSYAELAKLERSNAFRIKRVPPESTPAKLPADELGEFCWAPVAAAGVLTPGQNGEAGKGGRDGEPPPAAEANGELPKSVAADGTPHWYLEPKTIPAQDLCSGLVQQKKREGLSWTRIAAWNCTQSLMNPLNLAQALWQWGAAQLGAPRPAAAHPCAVPPAGLTAPAEGADWARTELRLQDGLFCLAGYVLPVLLGGIGSGVYVVRRIEQRLRDATLSAHDGTAGFGRVLLGATCGGLLGLLFGTDGPVQIGGFSLALGAWALLVGYGLETVLRLLDRLIEATVRTLGDQDKGRTVPVSSPPP